MKQHDLAIVKNRVKRKPRMFAARNDHRAIAMIKEPPRSVPLKRYTDKINVARDYANAKYTPGSTLPSCYRLHGHRWRRYWRNNFVVRLIPDNGDRDVDPIEATDRRSADRFDAQEPFEQWRFEEIEDYA